MFFDVNSEVVEESVNSLEFLSMSSVSFSFLLVVNRFKSSSKVCRSCCSCSMCKSCWNSNGLCQLFHAFIVVGFEFSSGRVGKVDRFYCIKFNKIFKSFLSFASANDF